MGYGFGAGGGAIFASWRSMDIVIGANDEHIIHSETVDSLIG